MTDDPASGVGPSARTDDDLRFDTITFLTDYGLVDEFVGVCRSVIRSLAPAVSVIDLTHDIAPHDIRAGSLTLARSVPYLHPGVVLAVVDPGVRTERRGVAVEVGGGQAYLVGPDNGLLAPAVSLCEGADRVVELKNPDYQLPRQGPTFDGRDVFAPAAAHLCRGVPLEELGPVIDPYTMRPGIVPIPRTEDDRLVAESLWVDRFGNVQLNVDPDEIDDWGDRLRVHTGEVVRTARRVAAFAELGTGEVGLLVDGSGLVAIVLDQMSAAELLGTGPGEEIRLERLEADAPDPVSIDLGRRA